MDQEFVDGYLDGHDLSTPVPSGNRRPAYVHSFKIGRAEALRQEPTMTAQQARKRAKLIEDNCNDQSNA